MFAIAAHILFCHAKRKGMYSDDLLSLHQSLLYQLIDLFDLAVCHRITADRDTISMHHQKASRSAMCPVVAVRIAKVEREMKSAVGIEPAFGHIVESFRTLPVAFTKLGPQITGECAGDKITSE